MVRHSGLPGLRRLRWGKGTLEITGHFGLVNVSGSGENFDQGDNLTMWAEVPFTTPSALVLDPHVRWEPIDDASARLVVPSKDGEESLRVEDCPATGLMTRMSGMRYRNREQTKAPDVGSLRIGGGSAA